jgi:hypothetical protein
MELMLKNKAKIEDPKFLKYFKFLIPQVVASLTWYCSHSKINNLRPGLAHYDD